MNSKNYHIMEQSDDIVDVVEQYQRVIRWYRIYEKINKTSMLIGSGDKSQYFDKSLDDVFAFFLNCFHLKDWILKYTDIPKDEVKQYMKDNPSLALCADIANGIKHARPDIEDIQKHRPHSGYRPEIESAVSMDEESLAAAKRGKPYQVGFLLVIHHKDDNKIDAFDVATECVCLWRKFLEKYDVFYKYQIWWEERGGFPPCLNHPDC